MPQKSAQEIIDYIARSEKTTPVKVYVNTTGPVDFGQAAVFGSGDSRIVFGDWRDLRPILEANRSQISACIVECDRRSSAVALLDLKDLSARVEPGAIIRDQAEIGAGAVIMMGAVINIGAVVGEGTMVDMNAVLGARATVGNHCHIGAGAVLSGVVEPASAVPVTVGDDVRIGSGAVVAAGAVVTADVPENAVAAGCPARVVKYKDAATRSKTVFTDALRAL